jgi:chromosome segregation ATPase
MSDDITPGARPRKMIKGLKSSGTIQVDGGQSSLPAPRTTTSAEPEAPAPPEREIQGIAKHAQVESVAVGDVAPEHREIRPLDASATVTEATPSGGIPLVVDEGADLAEDGEHSLSVLLGEVKSLRSRNQILRTERTSMAGRKYALEVVLETLKGKLEELGGMLEGVDAPGQLGELLGSIREAVGSARRVALGRDPHEGELEAERAQHLEERRALEQKASELSEQAAGLKAERRSLADRVTWLEKERIGLQESVVELEDTLAQREQALAAAQHKADEAETIRAETAEMRSRWGQHEKERAEYLDRIADLEQRVSGQGALEAQVQRLLAQVEEHRAEAARAVQSLEEALSLGEDATRGIEAERARTRAAEEKLAEAEAAAATAIQRATEAQARAEEAESRVAGSEARGSSAEVRIADAEARAAAAEAKLTELESRALAAEANAQTWETRATAAKSVAVESKGQLETVTGRYSKAEARVLALEAQVKELEGKAVAGDAKSKGAEGKLKELQARQAKLEKLLEEQRGALLAAKTMMEALEKDNNRMSRLLGDARARGRVNVEEILARAELIRRLERLAKAQPT